MDEDADIRPILYFDGVCNLCNNTVQFIIRHDRKKQFLFASLQSDAGRRALKEYSHTAAGTGSVLLRYKGRYYEQSGATLEVVRLLGGVWRLLYVFVIVPRFVRDGLYKIVARNRYKWFGKKDECMLPAAALKDRFIS